MFTLSFENLNMVPNGQIFDIGFLTTENFGFSIGRARLDYYVYAFQERDTTDTVISTSLILEISIKLVDYTNPGISYPVDITEIDLTSSAGPYYDYSADIFITLTNPMTISSEDELRNFQITLKYIITP